jgi:hypothetical protein
MIFVFCPVSFLKTKNFIQKGEHYGRIKRQNEEGHGVKEPE